MYTGPNVLGLFESLADEINLFNAFIDEAKKQADIDTATWSLDYYEKQYGIKEKKATVEERRKLVKVAMQRKTPMTKKKFEDILKNATGLGIKVIDNVENFVFELIIYTDDDEKINLESIKKLVKRYKPSHLTCKMIVEKPNKSILYYANTNYHGEVLNIRQVN